MEKLEKQLLKALKRLNKLKEQAKSIKSSKDPEIGSICKFWNANKKLFTIGKLENICGGLYFKYLNINNEKYYMNCEPLDPNMTLGEVFGKEGGNGI